MLFDLSELALFAALQLEHQRGGSVPPNPHALDDFVHAVTERLARYDCARPCNKDDNWVAPVIAQDDALLGAMGELTGNRGTSFSFGDGSPITTYHPEQVDELYEEAFLFIIEVDCAAREPADRETLLSLASRLAAFSRGARLHSHENGWRRRFMAA